MERTRNTTAEELTSRRAILAAVLGAAAATAAAAVLPAEHASAANGDPLILGQANTANDATDLDGQLVVHSSAGSDDNRSGVAVQGTSLTGPVCWDTLGGVGCDQRGRSRRRRRSPWRCYRRLRGHLRIRAHCAREGRAAKPKRPRLRRCGQIVCGCRPSLQGQSSRPSPLLRDPELVSTRGFRDEREGRYPVGGHAPHLPERRGHISNRRGLVRPELAFVVAVGGSLLPGRSAGRPA